MHSSASAPDRESITTLQCRQLEALVDLLLERLKTKVFEGKSDLMLFHRRTRRLQFLWPILKPVDTVRAVRIGGHGPWIGGQQQYSYVLREDGRTGLLSSHQSRGLRPTAYVELVEPSYASLLTVYHWLWFVCEDGQPRQVENMVTQTTRRAKERLDPALYRELTAQQKMRGYACGCGG